MSVSSQLSLRSKLTAWLAGMLTTLTQTRLLPTQRLESVAWNPCSMAPGPGQNNKTTSKHQTFTNVAEPLTLTLCSPATLLMSPSKMATSL